MQNQDSEDWGFVSAQLDSLGPRLSSIWGWGDGVGGEVIRHLMEVAQRHGLPTGVEVSTLAGQRPCPTAIRIAAFKRDGHRCTVCGLEDDLRAARIPAARGRRINSIDDVRTACVRHAASIRTGRA